MSKWVARLEYRLRGFGIGNLMLYITGTMFALYFAENILRMNISQYLILDRAMLFKGQVWRLLTFAVVPPPRNTFILWVLIGLFLLYWLGSSLEKTWGTTRFTLFYLFGMLGAVISALITGYAGNMYLNMSLFLAFAAVAPNMQLLIWFVIPVKVKWLAYLDLALLGLAFIFNTWSGRAAIIASLMNLILFFGEDFYNKFRNWRHYSRSRRNFRDSMRRNRNMYGDN